MSLDRIANQEPDSPDERDPAQAQEIMEALRLLKEAIEEKDFDLMDSRLLSLTNMPLSRQLQRHISEISE
ncbi:MAG: hypothetical protein LBT38_07305 [Deltaproteobacteria bacterium]|nr:hypothetical protein [Deltaproteobacteria bacterium]